MVVNDMKESKITNKIKKTVSCMLRRQRCSWSLFLSLIQLITLQQSLSVSRSVCSPLQKRTVMWACMLLSLYNLSICSSVFCLLLSFASFFIQCQANLVQREQSQRQWYSNKFQENYMFLCKKTEPEITPRKTPRWRLHCSLIHDRQKQQMVRMGTEKRNPQRSCLWRSFLHIALYPKMQFTGNQALVPAPTKLGAVPLSPAFLWKFLF